MPVSPTYPGVYIEEISSGVRTITGVATSITAFIGRARRGPVNIPVTINNFGDFERSFGPLWRESTLSFAVRDYYLNGGRQAIIVRLFHPSFANEAARLAARGTATTAAQTAANAVATAATNASTVAGATPSAVASAALGAVVGTPGTPEWDAGKAVAKAANDATAVSGATPQTVASAATAAVAGAVTAAANAAAPVTRANLDVGDLHLEAKYEGSWANSLRARVDHDVLPVNPHSFNLTVQDGQTGSIEVYRNVSTDTSSPRFVKNVLMSQSTLVNAIDPIPSSRPTMSAGSGTTPLGDTNSSKVSVLASDGKILELSNYTGSQTDKTGIYALEDADLFNLLCIPPYAPGGNVEDAVTTAAASYCEARRAMLIVDPPSNWNTKALAKTGMNAGVGTTSKNAAIFFPRLRQPNPENDNQIEDFVPCGAVAGIFSRTDAQRGVWKAPAGLDATLNGVPALSVQLTDDENGELNPLGVNCLRTRVPAGRVIWGSRTLQGDDRLASEWKYVPVRRTALFIEESLYRGTQWAVFEPNDEPLWAQLRLNIGAFMQNLFRQGAFQGQTPKDAYFVKADKETTTQNDINLGIVNVIVGFAPLKPAEFVIIKIQQIAGQIDT